MYCLEKKDLLLSFNGQFIFHKSYISLSNDDFNIELEQDKVLGNVYRI